MTTDIHQVDRDEARELIYDTGALTDLEESNLHSLLRITMHSWACYINGELVCVWGLCPSSLLDDKAYLWMRHTPQLNEHEFVFIRHSRLVLETIFKQYRAIVGLTAATDHKAIRWIQWLGGKYDSPKDGYRAFVIERLKNG